MSTTTLPLATLAAQITSAGASAPLFEDIVNSKIATYQGIFGSDVLLTPDTQDMQVIAVEATAVNDTNQLAIAVYNSFLPAYSQGTGLSAIVQINGLNRQSTSYSTVVVNLVGQAGAIIPNGVVKDTSSNLWNLPENLVLPQSGTLTVTATAQTAGNVSAAAGTVTTIYTITAGWQSVTNPTAAVAGTDAESDAALRKRQAISTALAAQTPVGSILAAVANSSGVGRAKIYENQTKVTDGNGQPGNSVAVVVEGGDVTTIAQLIQSKKAPGTGTYGTTAINVIDPAGVPITISFFELAEVPIFGQLVIQPLTGYVATTGAAAVTALVDFVADLPIGADVYYNQLLGAASLAGTSLSQTFVITTLQIGKTASALSTSNIVIPFTSAASCVAANITLTVAQ